jgi:DNA-binding winged helix-turn-helix (wHTH) protein/TolB-like protein
MEKIVSRLYEFGPFRLDPARYVLLRNGEPVHLPPKAFDVLSVLVRSAGRVVEKRELMDAVWPGLFVEEGNISVMIHIVRRALGCGHGGQKYIETVSKRGYRFSSTIRLVDAELARPAEPPSTASAAELPVQSGASTSVTSGNSIESAPSEALTLLRLEEGSNGSRHWMWIAFALIVLPLLILVLKRAHLRSTFKPWSNGEAIHPLAVLPFSVLSQKRQDAYLGLAMSDAITTRLDNNADIVIRPTSAVEKYVGTSNNPITAGREQLVDAVLDGHIQITADRIRLTVQLVHVGDGASVWGATFDGKYSNLFSAQDAMAEEVVRSIQLQLTGVEQKQFVRRSTENSDAYRAYIKGRYFWNK